MKENNQFYKDTALEIPDTALEILFNAFQTQVTKISHFLGLKRKASLKAWAICEWTKWPQF